LKDEGPKRVLVIYSYHEGLPWERIIDDNLRATLASKSIEPIELNIEHACQPVYDDQSNPLGFRASNRDITERKFAEIELQDAYTEIEQLKNQLEAETAYLRFLTFSGSNPH